MSVTLVIEPERLGGEEVAVEGAAYRHLFRARRLAVGDRVRLVDGAGRARWSLVVAVDRHSARLRLGEAAPSREPRLELTVLAAVPRPERAAWLVEKATELGVLAIRFLACERSPRSPSPAALERLRRVAVAAVEQSQRARVPEISAGHELAGLAGLVAGEGWFLVPDDGEPFTPPAGGALSVAVGPEGGWSPREADLLSTLGLRRASLPTPVLRIETAALAAAALALAR